MTFIERIRTVQPSQSVYATRNLKSYYNHDAVDEQLGGTAKERKAKLEHDTNGIGYTRTGKDGKVYHRNRKGEVEPVHDQSFGGIF